MPSRITLLCRCALVGSTIVAGWAAEGIRSPFMPEGGAAGAAVTPNAPLEYRGYMESAEGVQYRLFDSGSKKGFWVQKDLQNPEGVVFKSHDPVKDTLTVEQGGRSMTLEVRKSRILAGANPAPLPMPPPGGQPPQPSNVAPAVTQAVVLNPTPADEAKRLEAVAAEVARRRALREQAAQQPTPPQPAQNAPQPAQATR